jgi:hypothetical protein
MCCNEVSRLPLSASPTIPTECYKPGGNINKGRNYEMLAGCALPVHFICHFKLKAKKLLNYHQEMALAAQRLLITS